ncbi:phospholipase A [Thalassotalea agarivorans]|uniref:Phospholipase A1 n=1 Tax=Thalassotalea agarivorans TaxID=349064 RepID=A0A1I0E341_THASX|nr:phospholipase A [Thalassotalea agarivorans]SET39348.1 phospholipase A1 [Thalassotalea agarivorans]
MRLNRIIPLLSLCVVLSTQVVAETEQEAALEACILKKIQQDNNSKTVAQLKAECEEQVEGKDIAQLRTAAERATAFNPYVITPHKMNYTLPFFATNNINREVYEIRDDQWSEEMQSAEAKFQISFKVPLVSPDHYLFTEGDALAFGFTMQSWWQLYTSDLSRPFRETNYEPEFFYTMPTSWSPYDTSTMLTFGYVHQSNGRSQLISRSWNRLYADITFTKGNFLLSFKPWYIIPEGSKQTTPDEPANDNPDIGDYMGYFELTTAYKWHHYEFSIKGRQNFATNNGYAEVNFTFPLTGRLRGLVQYTTGYGESLIDYNHSQSRIGIGIALTDIM